MHPRRRIRFPDPVLMLMLVALSSATAQAQDGGPDLGGMSANVSITAPDIELGKLLDYVSGRTGTPILPDRRISAVRLTVLGANGPASELLDAVEAATGLQLRRLDDWYVLCADRRGAAAVAHQYRRLEGRTLMARQAALTLKADAVARRAGLRFWSNLSQPYFPGLAEGQMALLRRQGFLTVADLFPEYYQPMYDIFGNLVDRSSERPTSLPEFAGARVYYYPGLQLLVHLPAQPAPEGSATAQAQPLTRTIDLGGL